MLGLDRKTRGDRIERERVERVETRIKRDIRGWIGWDYIEECVELCEYPLAVLLAFITGGRASEILDYSRGMFADMGGWYEARMLPVYKRFRILEKIVGPDGKRTYITQPLMERRTIPIRKDEPLAGMLWDLIKDIPRGEPLLHWPDHDHQYWQFYKCVSRIRPPTSPLAPQYHKGVSMGQQKNLYPHWFRGMRAAQLRVEYNLAPDILCDFFKWETLDMAKHYAGLSIVDMVVAMKQGERFIEIWESMMRRE